MDVIIGGLLAFIGTALSAYFAYLAKKHGDKQIAILKQRELDLEEDKLETSRMEAINNATVRLLKPMNERMDKMDTWLRDKRQLVDILEKKVEKGSAERANLYIIIEQLKEERRVFAAALREVIELTLENIQYHRSRNGSETEDEKCPPCEEADTVLETKLMVVMNRVAEATNNHQT